MSESLRFSQCILFFLSHIMTVFLASIFFYDIEDVVVSATIISTAIKRFDKISIWLNKVRNVHPLLNTAVAVCASSLQAGDKDGNSICLWYTKGLCDSVSCLILVLAQSLFAFLKKQWRNLPIFLWKDFVRLSINVHKMLGATSSSKLCMFNSGWTLFQTITMKQKG